MADRLSERIGPLKAPGVSYAVILLNFQLGKLCTWQQLSTVNFLPYPISVFQIKQLHGGSAMESKYESLMGILAFNLKL